MTWSNYQGILHLQLNSITVNKSLLNAHCVPPDSGVRALPVSYGPTLMDHMTEQRSGRSPGVGNGNPLQSSCLENPMDREAWWATVHRVAKSQIPLSD